MIKHVNDDGSVGAQGIDRNEAGSIKEITIIEMDILISSYRHAQKRIKLLEGYPENAAIGSDEFKHMISRSAAALAMKRMSEDNAYKKMTWRVQKYPKERLFALNPAAKQCLRVVPITHKLTEQAALCTSTDVVVVNGTKLLLQRNVSSQCASEFFVMRIVHDDKKANMKLKVFKETVEGVEVKVPCAVNFKDVAGGDEIVLYKPALVKEAPKAKAVAAVLEPLAKKAKIA